MTAYVETAPPARPPLPRLSVIELRKMADTRAGFWLLVGVGLIATGIVVVLLAAGDGDDRDLQSMFTAALFGTSVLLPVVGILAVTSEWSQRTALTTFTLVPQRWRVMVAKTNAAIVLALLAVIACLVPALLGNLVAGGSWALGLSGVASGALYQLLNMLGGFAFGLLFLNSALAIVAYFVLPIAWSLLGELIDALPAEWLDTGVTFQPLVENQMAGGDWAPLATSCALWILLPLLLGALRLQRAEVKSA